jgi:hypothetical protein
MSQSEYDIWGEPDGSGVVTLNQRPEAASRREEFELSRNINENMLDLRIREYKSVEDDVHPIAYRDADLSLDAYDAVAVMDCMTRLDGDDLRFPCRGVSLAGDTVSVHGLPGLGWTSVIGVPSKESE